MLAMLVSGHPKMLLFSTGNRLELQGTSIPSLAPPGDGWVFLEQQKNGNENIIYYTIVIVYSVYELSVLYIILLLCPNTHFGCSKVCTFLSLGSVFSGQIELRMVIFFTLIFNSPYPNSA